MPRTTASTPDKTVSDNEQGQPAGDRAVVALDAHIDLLSWLDSASSIEMTELFVGHHLFVGAIADYPPLEGDHRSGT